MLFDEVGAVQLIEQYRAAPTSSCLNRIVRKFEALVYSLIPLPSSHPEFDDLYQEGLIKVTQLVDKWDTRKGKAYSFFSTSIKNRYNTLLSSRAFNHRQDYVPVENLDVYLQDEIKIPDQDNVDLIPLKIARVHWRTSDPTLFKACEWYKQCLVENVQGREKIHKTMCVLFGITPADAEYVMGLVSVTLRQRLSMYEY